MDNFKLDNCPVCDHPSGIDDREEWDDPISPGEIIICSQCSAVLIFTDDDDLEYCTDEMLAEMPDEDQAQIAQMLSIIASEDNNSKN